MAERHIELMLAQVAKPDGRCSELFVGPAAALDAEYFGLVEVAQALGGLADERAAAVLPYQGVDEGAPAHQSGVIKELTQPELPGGHGATIVEICLTGLGRCSAGNRTRRFLAGAGATPHEQAVDGAR